MRHPTTGLSEDDLSRLTGSSSSTNSSSSNSSSSSSSSAANSPKHQEEGIADDNVSTYEYNNHRQQSPENITAYKNNTNKKSHSHTNVNSSTRISSTYLPEIINPLEWQKSRKRKERLDSSSSATQDRKLQRSNSEELLPVPSSEVTNIDAAADGVGDGVTLKVTKTADVIRRVSSEDFKRTPYTAYEQEILKDLETDKNEIGKNKEGNEEATADENDASLANRQQYQSDPLPPTKDMVRRSRYETSPARSQRLSPIRGNGSNGKHRDSDDSECEHERRRSSERFCKSRAPPGRKAAGVMKKSGGSGSSSSGGKYLPSKRNDENAYKYDLSALKYERRGFISKKVVNPEKTANDHNDNNLIDFHQQKKAPTTATPSPTISPTPTPIGNDETTAAPITAPKKTVNNTPIICAQEALPWGRSVPEDQTPMLSRRYAAVRHHTADSIDTAAKLSKVMPYPQPFHKQLAAQLYADDMDCMEPLDAYRAFTSLENIRTREVMQQIIPSMMSFQSPEERLKQVNKRLAALKKKLSQLEEAYEARAGYRPSQAERLNDKYMKNVLAELSKLRKERQELKSDPMGALGLKVSGGMDATTKLEKMKSSLLEIEQSLADKRAGASRNEALEDLTPDQLVQEKTAVQHGLLYLESMYGRPTTKDERDAARPLYDRYRQLKRMVTRSVLLSGAAPELPTILEHEAMVFESTPQQYSSNNSTDTTNSPSEPVAANVSSDDSTTTTTAGTAQAIQETTATTAATAPSETYENVSALSIDQLWDLLDKTREEKKLLKRTIREYETVFEEQNGRKMLKNDRKMIEETYAQYKKKKAKTRLLQALIKKHISR